MPGHGTAIGSPLTGVTIRGNEVYGCRRGVSIWSPRVGRDRLPIRRAQVTDNYIQGHEGIVAKGLISAAVIRHNTFDLARPDRAVVLGTGVEAEVFDNIPLE